MWLMVFKCVLFLFIGWLGMLFGIVIFWVLKLCFSVLESVLSVVLIFIGFSDFI